MNKSVETSNENKQNEMKFKIWIEQYRRCEEDWRHFDKMLWEIPFATATVLGAILAFAYGDVAGIVGQLSLEVKIPLLDILLVLVITMFSLSRKIRFFQEGRTRFAEHIEEKVAKVKILPIRTSDVQELLRKDNASRKLIGYRAVHFQNLLFLGYLLILGVLLLIEGFWGVLSLVLLTMAVCTAYFWDRIIKYADVTKSTLNP